MEKPKGTKNRMLSPQEKENIVLEYLNGNCGLRVIARKYDTQHTRILKWVRKYQESGKEGLISQTGRKTGSNSGRSKKPTTEEEKLKREVAKLEIEVARLKKGYQVKGVGAQKEYVTTFEENTK